jgi:tetratricopeptide (TPR) repeat protein
MRVALCISGQIRNAEQMLPRLAAFARSMEADVFVSTWTMPGTKVSGVQGIWHVDRMFGPLFCSFMPEWMCLDRGIVGVFPKFASEIDEGIRQAASPISAIDLQAHFPNARIDLEDATTLDLSLETQHSDDNSLRMLYKMWRCNELRRRAEVEQGYRYDVVLRARPDIVPDPIPASVLAELSAPNCRVVLVDDIRPNIVGDKFALSGPAVADEISALFAKAVAAPARPWRGIHHEFHDHLHERKLEPRLHLVAWQWAAAAPYQAMGREILLRQFVRQAFAPNLPAVAAGPMHDLARLLTVADRLQVADLAAAEGALAEAMGIAIAHDHAGEVMLHHALILATLLYSAKGDHHTARAAGLLAWMERVRLSGAGQSPPALHLQAVIKAVLEIPTGAGPIGNLELATATEWLRGAGINEILRPVLALHEADDLSKLAPALQDLQAMHEGSPAHIEATRARGFHLLNSGNNLAAREAAETMIRLAPGNWYGYDLMGHVLERSRDPEGALVYAIRALECFPLQGGLQARVGFVLVFLLSRPQEALVYLKRANELWDDARPWFWYAIALEQSADHDTALIAIAEAIKRDGGNAYYRAAHDQIVQGKAGSAA